jgi:hypothetical protein
MSSSQGTTRTTALRLVAAAGLAGAVAAGGTVNAQAATGVQRPDWAALFVGQTNADRVMYHHARLTSTSALTTSAQRWAATMVAGFWARNRIQILT